MRLWDVDAHTSLGAIQGAAGSFNGIVPQPGTGVIATAATNDAVDIWQTDFTTVLDQICTALRGQQSIADAWAAIGADSNQTPRCSAGNQPIS